MSSQVTENKILTPKEERSPKEAITEAMGDMRQTARGLYERTKSRAAEFEGDFEDYVRDNPVRSLAIAAGIGAGLGLLVGILAARR